MTPRWTPIKEVNGRGLSGEREKYFNELISLNKPNPQRRFVLAPCGRRSLKTELALRAMALAFLDVKPWDDPRYFICGPTFGQVKRVAWNKIKALIPEYSKARVYESDLCIVSKSGAELWLAGLDKPDRIEGNSIDGMHITEYANCKDIWDANIRAALADRMGWAILEGTPDVDGPNNIKYEDQYNRAVSGKDAEWAAFVWSSREVLDPREIASMERTMDELYFEQEVGGKFVRTPDLAYHKYTEADNVTESAVFNPRLPVTIACDFNHDHHNWVLLQINRNVELGTVTKVHAFDQLYLRGAEIATMCNGLKELCKHYNVDPLKLTFYGDYSGVQKRAEATWDAWTQIKLHFREGNRSAEFVIKTPPPIPDRIRAVNSYICNVNSERRLLVNPKCTELRQDFRYVTRTQLLSEHGKAGARTHASDAVGYALHPWYRAETKEEKKRGSA